MNRPLFPTLDSVVRRREVGQAKDLSAPPRMIAWEKHTNCRDPVFMWHMCWHYSQNSGNFWGLRS